MCDRSLELVGLRGFNVVYDDTEIILYELLVYGISLLNQLARPSL